MRKKMFYFAPLALMGIAVFILIGGEIVMHLWNWLTPELFGWRQINFSKRLACWLFAGYCSEGSAAVVQCAPPCAGEWPTAGTSEWLSVGKK